MERLLRLRYPLPAVGSKPQVGLTLKKWGSHKSTNTRRRDPSLPPHCLPELASSGAP